MTNTKRQRTLKKLIWQPVREFISDSRAVGIVLLVCTAFSMIFSATDAGVGYMAFWNQEQALFHKLHLPHSMLHFINDALMSIFFLLAGAEIKYEFKAGNLASPRKAALPIVAALGGMVVPALIFYAFTAGTPYSGGWGVPMATDIAFSLGVLSLAGKRAPLEARVLLLALAIIDDIGGILVIGIFYGEPLAWNWFTGMAACTGALLLLNIMKVQQLWIYILLGLPLWYCTYLSGIHPSIAGVLLAFTIPLARMKSLIHYLHDPVSFIILPLFALANTAISLAGISIDGAHAWLIAGILGGLLIGKPLGIAGAVILCQKMGLIQLPGRTGKRTIIAIGCLAGIGFTMSLFITVLAFDDAQAQQISKASVVLASLLSGVLGFVLIRR